jgi:hypothetical protein
VFEIPLVLVGWLILVGAIFEFLIFAVGVLADVGESGGLGVVGFADFRRGVVFGLG